MMQFASNWVTAVMTSVPCASIHPQTIVQVKVSVVIECARGFFSVCIELHLIDWPLMIGLVCGDFT